MKVKVLSIPLLPTLRARKRMLPMLLICLFTSVINIQPVKTRALTERFENYFQSRENVVYISTWSGPPSGWNPLLPSPAWGNNLQYESLFVYSTRDDVWIPWLAESYTWVDKLTLMIRIRAEARWWDGEPLTAQDVKYTLELGKKYGVSWSYVWDYLEDVAVVDDKRVLLMTSEDKLNYFEFVGLLDDVIVMPKHRWEVLEEELGDKVTQFLDDDPEKIVASGCYKLCQWSEDVWYYKRVEDWWGKEIFGLPSPTYVGHIGYTDNVEALLAFERGEYDGGAFFFPSVWELWEVKGLPIRTYYKDPPYYIGSEVIFLYVNYANYPLNYSAVRRAISYAIPYDDLVSKAYFNYSVRASPSMIIDTIPAYAKWINDSLVEMYGYEYDLTKAAQVLDDADILDTDCDGIREMPDGTLLGPYTISVPYGWSDWMMMCDMISADLQSIGINVTTDFPDFSVWFDRLHKGMFDFVISWDAGMGFDHPWNTFRFVMDPRLTGPVGEPYPAGNWERYMNEDVIPLLDSVAKDPDPVKLKEIYSQLQELGLTELPAIPLFYGAAWYEYSTAYWVGWPCEEDPRWLSPSPWDYPNNIPVYFGLSRASEGIKPMPSWVTDLQISTTKIFQDLAEAPRVHAETTDETGEWKDVFDIPETVYISGSRYSPSSCYDLYVVEDTTWSDNMDIPDRVSGSETSVTTDEKGDIPVGTVAWNGPLTTGKYDIIIDVNSNGKYDEDIDALDDEDIEVTAGFFVIPEFPIGTLMGIITCLVALVTFRFKRLNLKH